MKQLLNGKDWKLESDLLQEPIAATVPGVVQQDLIDAKLTTDFWYGCGPADKYEACQHDWIYTKEFTLDDSYAGKRLSLEFECVDFTCKVFVNGVEVGANNGEYKLFRLDITDAAKVPGVNTLRVEIEKMPPELLELLIKSDGPESGVNSKDFEFWFVTAMNKTRQRLCGLKSIATYSYDWSSNLYTLGIPKDVYLVATEKVRIDWLKYQYFFYDNYDRAEVEIEAEVDASADVPAEFTFTLSRGGKTYTAKASADLKKGNGFVKATVSVDHPDLWWPVGYGEHPLYDVTVTAAVGENVSDTKTEKIGLREIVWKQCEGLPEDFIHPFALHINGKLVRTFGSCIITMDAFKGHEPKAMQSYLAELALRGNMTALRVHGGQTYYYNDFHDYCDAHGLMLLMDMPLGNCVPEDLPGMYDMYRETLSNFIKQLRRHPCIIEWTGGNEMGWYTDPTMIHPALQVMLDVGKDCDPQRIFRSTCPIVGSRHGHYDYNPDNHYEEYNAMFTDNCNNAPMQRNGEFACSTPGNMEVWRKYMPACDRFPIDSENEDLIRKNAVHSINPEMWLNQAMIERMFGKCDSLEKLLRAGQLLSGEGIRYAMDNFRSRGKKFSGFSTWCYNEPAPNAAGCGFVDFEGQPYQNYYMAKEAMAPVAICMQTDSVFYNSTDSSYADIVITSDAPSSTANLYWEWVLRDRRGNILRANSGQLHYIGSVESVKVDRVKLNPPIAMKTGPVFLEMRLIRNGVIISERVQFFAMKGIVAPLGGLINKNTPDVDFGIPYTMTGQCGGGIRQTAIAVDILEQGMNRAVYRIRNTGDMIALYCQIKPLAAHIPMLYIDRNFISIPPKSERIVTLESPVESLLGVGVTVEGFNTEKVEVLPDNALLVMGRFDSTNEDYADTAADKVITAENKKVAPAKVARILEDTLSLDFTAPAGNCLVVLGISDTAKEGAELTVTLNGTAQKLTFAPGYGLKKEDKYQLCVPERRELVFTDAMTEGTNRLTLKVEKGFIAWDALRIVRI